MNNLQDLHVDQLIDANPDETAEWHQSLDSLIKHAGPARARYLMLSLIKRAHEANIQLPNLRLTDYMNTIPPESEPQFPGDEFVERRIRAYIRWNAAIMVHRAQRPGVGVGGHISTFASSAALYEVGFNHFFKGKDHPSGGDQIFFQGHASPGMYARAFLEGRLSEHQLDGFRQELSHSGGGLSSYPHPRLMPEFWEFPTVSMGLGPINSIYQARFNRYLHNRGIKDTSGQHVWAFLGDGEMDEPESVSALTLAARENLDNLTFVINCNLQRLDGPVRGNGKIIQELEALFTGAGWNVIKVVWGREWDPLFAMDKEGALVELMNKTPDGDFQTYKAESGAFVRENFFNRDPRTAAMVANWSDDDIWNLKRGGHDYQKLYAAYRSAMNHTGQPTVILAKTIKGWTLGSHFEGRNATHQMKKLKLEDLKSLRDRLYLEIDDEKLDEKIAASLKMPIYSSKLIAEGGDNEINSKGVLMLTESVQFLRNPQLTKKQIEEEYRKTLGATSFIWFKKGLRDDDFTLHGPLVTKQGDSLFTCLTTNGHVDEYARFANDSTILMAFGDVLSENRIEKETATRLAENLTILKRSRNADGKPFYIIFLPLVPPQISEMKKGDGTYDILQSMTFKNDIKYGFRDKPEKMIAAASYLNFVIINKLVLVPFYGLETDEKAMVAFKKAFPDKKIVPINPLALHWGGGGMHCITQNEPF